jgi:hypothetical protein
MFDKRKFFMLPVVAVLIVAVCVVMIGCSKKEEPTPPPAEPAATGSAVETPPPTPTVFFSPYTGLPVTDNKDVGRRPLSIKIENSPASWPQMGLNSADVVYETRVEGGMSRFNCLFQSTLPEEVGPVRSARLSDAWIVPQYSALFYYSGSNSEVKGRLNSAGVTFGPSGDLLHRVSFKKAPHNLYMDVTGAYKAAEKKEIALTVELKPLYYGFERATDGAITGDPIVPIISKVAVKAAVSGSAIEEGEELSEDIAGEASQGVTGGASPQQMSEVFTGKEAESVSIGFYSEAKWQWDKEKNVWLRYTAGKEHFDGATDEQIYTDNVVVLYAEYPRAAKLDPAGSPTYDTTLGGEGKALLFRDGYVFECTWKADKDTPPALFDAQGKQLPLKQGKTWFEVPPTSGMEVEVKGPEDAVANTE